MDYIETFLLVLIGIVLIWASFFWVLSLVTFYQEYKDFITCQQRNGVITEINGETRCVEDNFKEIIVE